MSIDLLKQIDELVASKTFNLDALDGIKQIKDNLAAVIAERDRLIKRVELITEDMTAETRKREAAEAKADDLHKRLMGMTEISQKGADAIWEKKIAEASAAAYKDALYTVFKPSAVRETVSRAIPVAVPMNNNGYMGTVSMHSETGTVTREDA